MSVGHIDGDVQQLDMNMKIQGGIEKKVLQVDL